MDNTIVTIDKIIEWLTQQVEQKLPIDTHTWIEAAQKMNVLLQNEQERLFEMEQQVSLLRKTLLDDGKTVAYAKTMVESTDDMRSMKVQKAKIDRCLEMIRIAKLQARMAKEMMGSQM